MYVWTPGATCRSRVTSKRVSHYLLLELQINYAASDAIVALHILRALVERKLSKEDRQTPVAPSPAQLKPANKTGLRMFSGEMYQLGSREVTGQDWLLQGENYSTLVSLCKGIVDVAYRLPRSSGHVRHMHVVCITACSKVNTGNCLWTFFIKVQFSCNISL